MHLRETIFARMGVETFLEGSILVKYQGEELDEFNEPKFCFETEYILGKREFIVKFRPYRGGPDYFIEEFLETYREWSKLELKFETETFFNLRENGYVYYTRLYESQF